MGVSVPCDTLTATIIICDFISIPFIYLSLPCLCIVILHPLFHLYFYLYFLLLSATFLLSLLYLSTFYNGSINFSHILPIPSLLSATFLLSRFTTYLLSIILFHYPTFPSFTIPPTSMYFSCKFHVFLPCAILLCLSYQSLFSSYPFHVFLPYAILLCPMSIFILSLPCLFLSSFLNPHVHLISSTLL